MVIFVGPFNNACEHQQLLHCHTRRLLSGRQAKHIVRTLWSVNSTIPGLCTYSILTETRAASRWQGMSCNTFVSSHISYHAASPSSASRDAPTSTLGAGSTCDGASHRSSTLGRCSPVSVCCFLCSAALGLKGPNAASQPPLAGPAPMNSSHSAYADEVIVRDPWHAGGGLRAPSVSYGTFYCLHLHAAASLYSLAARVMVREARMCTGR